MNNSTKKKIFIISQSEVTYTVGGAITVFINMCNMLSQNGYEIYGICSSKTDGYPKNLNKNINFINLYYKYPNISFSEAINKFTEKENPDLFIFFFNFLYIKAELSDKYDHIPRILMFHSRPDIYFRSNCDIENLHIVYKNTVSQILFDSYYKLLPEFIRNSSVITIPNGTLISKEIKKQDTEYKKIIYLSRIDCFKGLEFLINSFSLIANKYQDWQIDIYGQAEPTEYIKQLINLTKELKIHNQINFKGITHEPLKTFLEYDFCVFPSYFEGFPVGLIEAQSKGLPSIGLKGCSGVNELIIDGYNGYLVEENYEDMASKIEMLIKNKDIRDKFSQNTITEASKYDIKNINKKWLEVIEKIIDKTFQNINIQCLTKDTKNLFSIDKIMNLKKEKLKWYQYIFSTTNKYKNGQKIKIIYILGIKISFKKN